MAIGPGIVLRPTGESLAPVRHVTAKPAANAAEVRVGMLRIHQSGEDPFRVLAPVLRQRNVVLALNVGVNTEWSLAGKQHANQGQATTPSPHSPLRINMHR